MADVISGADKKRLTIAAIRRAVGRISGGGPRNVTAKGARLLKSARGAKKAGGLRTSKAGKATRAYIRKEYR